MIRSSALALSPGSFALAGLSLKDRLVRRAAALALLPQALAPLRATGLAAPLPSLVRGDAHVAAEIYRGRHRLDANAGGSALHGFAWLAHMKAASNDLSCVQARALVDDWIAARSWRVAEARSTSTRSRRIISWLQYAAFLTKGADKAFQERFLNSLARQATSLARRLPAELDARARLDAATALSYAAVGLAGLEPLAAGAFAALEREIEAQILPDGGHVSRNPAVLAEILLDLLPLRGALETSRQPIPQALHAGLERMLPMLRLLAHGDGGLAVFNGVRDTMAGRVRAVLDCDQTCGRPLNHATHSGYCRLSQGRVLVIADTGRPTAPGLNPLAASSPLAFELSDGVNRIVVSCGAPIALGTEWDRASLETAAHSTVSLGGESAGQISIGGIARAVFGTPMIEGPASVDCNLLLTPEGSMMEGRHDGYVAPFGIVHERRLYLAANGADLRGEDRFRPDLERGDISNVAFAARFHLHPSVKATLSKDGRSVMLLLPDKAGWRFTARGGELALEDSAYLPGPHASRRSQQIVLRGIVGRPDRINWAFKRIDKRAPATPKAPDAAPGLPF